MYQTHAYSIFKVITQEKQIQSYFQTFLLIRIALDLYLYVVDGKEIFISIIELKAKGP